MARLISVLTLLTALVPNRPLGSEQEISMYAIIANPSAFEGKKVRVLGVIESDARGIWVFVDPWHREMYDASNALYAEMSNEAVRSKARTLLGKGAWVSGVVARRSASNGIGGTKEETVLTHVDAVMAAP